jgi:Na+/phosphate symporter
LDDGLKISEETEGFLRDIYKELYLAAQTTFEAMAEISPAKANEVNASKQHFNGLVERARGHLYTRLRSEEPGQLQEYKIESNTLENFKRIHNMLRSLCKLILERVTPSAEVSPGFAAEEADGKSA